MKTSPQSSRRAAGLGLLTIAGYHFPVEEFGQPDLAGLLLYLELVLRVAVHNLVDYFSILALQFTRN